MPDNIFKELNSHSTKVTVITSRFIDKKTGKEYGIPEDKTKIVLNT